MNEAIALRSDRNAMSETLNSTIKFLDEVANVSIRNLQTDMNAIKLSMLVQTCGDMGKQQGDLRLYTSEECDAMNGNYHPNGECLKKEGGSFSYDCGMLYKGKNVGTKSVNTNAVANNTGMETFNWSKEPFNWSKEPGGQSDVTGTAFRVAAKMGLRASIVSETEKFGWSLPIGSEYGLEAMEEADNTFMASLENNLSPMEAARLAATAAAETEDRIRLVNASVKAAHHLKLGSKTVNQTSTGWSLPLGQYSTVEAVAADQAFQKKIAAAATPYAPTEQERLAAADAALTIVRLRRIAFDMGLGVMGKTLGKTRAPSSIALYGYSLPNGTYTVGAATAADAAFEAAYLAGASPAEAAAAALKAATNAEAAAAFAASAAPAGAPAAPAAAALKAATDNFSAPAVPSPPKTSTPGTVAPAANLFSGTGGRRKRTRRGKGGRRGTRRYRK
jgi:hypothetical protein